MTERFPGYDVLSKRGTPSWNDKTRKVVDERLAIRPDRHDFFDEDEWAALKAVCARILPQPPDRSLPVPLPALIDHKLATNKGDGYRDARLPPMGDAWKRGLRAIDAEAVVRHQRPFHQLSGAEQDGILSAVQKGYASDPAWAGMAPALFFSKRLIHDCVGAYYGHPTAWNEIGFGGPAAPRGYVRMDLDRRDPWEASEAYPGHEDDALRENSRVGRT
jgi:hypothetical protein